MWAFCLTFGSVFIASAYDEWGVKGAVVCFLVLLAISSVSVGDM